MVIHARNLVPSTTDRALGGSVIEKSLKFFSGASTELTRTPSGAGNRRTWTLSFWTKICSDDLGSHGFLFSTGADSSNKVQIKCTAKQVVYSFNRRICGANIFI